MTGNNELEQRPKIGKSDDIHALARIILSDCGCSTEYVALLDRVEARLWVFFDEQLAASQAREAKLREALKMAISEAVGWYDEARNFNEHRHKHPDWLLSIDAALSQPTDDTALREYVKDIERSLDWYKRRVTFLQEWQSKMRDPERTIVCDIIANGLTMEEGGRYSLDKDAALRELITKAGEVMRERCIGVSQDEMDEQFVDSDPWYSARSCRDSIRALPAVTLDDLKGGV